MSEDTYELLLLAFQLGVALFCANQLFLHQRHQRIYVPLALFFAAQSIDTLSEIIDMLSEGGEYEHGIALLCSLSLPAAFAQPLMFWLYVRALTSEGGTPNPITHKGLHALPLVVSLSMIILLFTLPQSLFVQDTPHLDALGTWPVLVLIYFQIIFVIYLVQIAIYLFLTTRMLRAYSTRLKDLFATTENRELAWLWWITAIVSVFLLIGFVEIALSITGLDAALTDWTGLWMINHLSSLAITWVIAIWGVRQQPGLMRDLGANAAEHDLPEAQPAKYERSALTDDHAARIAGKIEKAMSKDLLHRNPNLSLWDLAKHIAVTSNYVSQTLNTAFKSNFFDYVNKWRIQDAVKQLRETDETILAITYDVGFNSRSSFYKAFKREMGTTPSSLRTEDA